MARQPPDGLLEMQVSLGGVPPVVVKTPFIGPSLKKLPINRFSSFCLNTTIFII